MICPNCKERFMVILNLGQPEFRAFGGCGVCDGTWYWKINTEGTRIERAIIARRYRIEFVGNTPRGEYDMICSYAGDILARFWRIGKL